MGATANERQVGGNHYKKDAGAVEHWDIVAQHNLDYFQGQITKYVMRWRDKGGTVDLHKARHFLDKYIELQGAPPAGGPIDKGSPEKDCPQGPASAGPGFLRYNT